MASAARTLLQQRLAPRRLGWLGVRSTLRHFALITYALPKERLLPHVPAEHFEIAEFPLEAGPRALLSVVPFWDADFHFPRLAPCLKTGFGQTNHRVYGRDRRTGEPAVWFLGTTLGSALVAFPRLLWSLPWHRARYRLECRRDERRGRYSRFAYAIDSGWCSGTVELEDSGAPMGLLPGFDSLDEQVLVLTHPVTGFYRRRDGALGSYSIAHPPMSLTVAAPRRLHFGLYERLGLLSRAELERPHSALLCPEVRFDIFLPPRRLAPA